MLARRSRDESAQALARQSFVRGPNYATPRLAAGCLNRANFKPGKHSDSAETRPGGWALV